jgi:hypothetical protein
MPLTTKTKVKEALGITVTTYDTQITDLLPIIDSIIEEEVNRILGAANYRTWRRAHGGDVLYLDNYPINSITRVARDSEAVARLSSAVSGSTHSFVSVTPTGITYTDIVSGVADTNTSSFASFATLTLIAADAPAGWTFTLESGKGEYPSIWLKPTQSAPALNPVFHELEFPFTDIQVEIGDFENGKIIAVDDFFPSGRKELFVDYNAGYTTPIEGGADGNVPRALEDVANQMVWNAVKGLKADRTLESEKLGDYAYKRAAIDKLGDIILTQPLKNRLSPFKKIIV